MDADRQDFQQFQSLFAIDHTPISNFLQYNIMQRRFYTEWCHSFCMPCLYKKIKREGAHLVCPPTDFSKVDKYVIAFGKSITTFSGNPQAYLDYVVYLPIDYGGYQTVGNQYKKEIEINAPYDDRFEYSQGDLLLFKLNDFIFKFQVVDEPTSMSGIMYKLRLNYVDKCSIKDLNQVQSEAPRESQGQYW